jgi:hypothetical protein
MTQQAVTRQRCGACGGELCSLLDENGALSREFLTARGSCCTNGCRNCPYDKPQSITGQAVVCATKKTCERCAATFECRSAACWCHEVRLSPATLKWLERQYEDCLCPDCLKSFSAC